MADTRLNDLLIESPQRFYYFLGHVHQVQYPIRSGQLTSIGSRGCRRVFVGMTKFQRNPIWRDSLLCYKHFPATSV